VVVDSSISTPTGSGELRARLEGAGGKGRQVRSVRGHACRPQGITTVDKEKVASMPETKHSLLRALTLTDAIYISLAHIDDFSSRR